MSVPSTVIEAPAIGAPVAPSRTRPPDGWAAAGNRSMKLAEIAALRPLNEAWAMADLDWEVPASAPSLGIDRTPYVAKTPVHGDTRTALYFDLHVGKIKNKDWIKW